MAHAYIDTFASHMDKASTIKVEVAKHTQQLERSHVYITSNLSTIFKSSLGYSFNIVEGAVNSYNPNIDKLFHSCVLLDNNVEILACILTGIGEDGAKGMAELSKGNAACIAENEESAVVYGMPKRAKELCSSVKVESLDEIIQTINKFGA